MNYQWYPGHMTKAKRQMQEDIKIIDLIIEIVDARIPMASRNPDIDDLGRGKARMILLNKSDLSDPSVNKAWKEYFESNGIVCAEIDSKNKNGLKDMRGLIEKACMSKLERDKKRGIKNSIVRAMIVGIPNVGKSTFINAFVGKNMAKTGNRPGVTKGRQWIKVGKNIELLDTPGILWPKFDDNITGLKLASVGSINDEIIIAEELALDILALSDAVNDRVRTYYGLEDEKGYDLLQGLAIKRGCVKKAGEPDTEKAAKVFIDDFRSGKLGRISLEIPGDIYNGSGKTS